MSGRIVLAVDGGNSKTLACVAAGSGEVLSLARAGGCNFQGIGRAASRKALARVIGDALEEAGIGKVDAACYGLAGADRDKDFLVFEEILGPIDPAEKSELVNDSLLALRAATPDGVGVALIGGAGSNCIGVGADGRIRKAWGLGPITGDKANGGSIALAGLVEAMKGIDGRSVPGLLEEKFKKALGLEALVDIIEREYFDSPDPLDPAALAPLVFEAAAEGDRAAREILKDQGKAAGEAALAVMRRLFNKEESVVLALGGSVLQKGSHPALVEAIGETVAAEFPRVRLIALDCPPLLGGALKALDALSIKLDGEKRGRLQAELEKRIEELSTGEEEG